jgi:hypothetical protein
MKHTFCFILLYFSFHFANAQDLAGRKIVNGNLSAQIISQGKNYGSTTTINTSLLFGKIKKDNTYWAFGGNFSIIPSSSVNNYISVGPSIERGKFVPLIDKLYLAPYLGGSAAGVFGDLTGVNLHLYASPIRFMYHFKENLMFTAGFGLANIDYSNIGSVSILSINASLNNNSGFGIFYTFE